MDEQQHERLLNAARELTESAYLMFLRQQALIEAINGFSAAPVEQPDPTPAAVKLSPDAIVVSRDSLGQFAAMSIAGQMLHNSAVESYQLPLTLWIVDKGHIVKKQTLDQYDKVTQMVTQ